MLLHIDSLPLSAWSVGGPRRRNYNHMISRYNIPSNTQLLINLPAKIDPWPIRACSKCPSCHSIESGSCKSLLHLADPADTCYTCVPMCIPECDTLDSLSFCSLKQPTTSFMSLLNLTQESYRNVSKWKIQNLLDSFPRPFRKRRFFRPSLLRSRILVRCVLLLDRRCRCCGPGLCKRCSWTSWICWTT